MSDGMDLPSDVAQERAREEWIKDNHHSTSVYDEDDVSEAFDAGVEWCLGQWKLSLTERYEGE